MACQHCRYFFPYQWQNTEVLDLTPACCACFDCVLIGDAKRIQTFGTVNNPRNGRATATVSLPPDDARYVPFGLNKEIPLSLTRFIELDLKGF